MFDVSPGDIFKNRLLGTGLAGFLPPVDWRGLIASEQQGEVFERLQRALEWVVSERAPLRSYTRNAALPGQGFQGMENILVPLSGNGKDIDVIVMVSLMDNVRLKG